MKWQEKNKKKKNGSAKDAKEREGIQRIHSLSSSRSFASFADESRLHLGGASLTATGVPAARRLTPPTTIGSPALRLRDLVTSSHSPIRTPVSMGISTALPSLVV